MYSNKPIGIFDSGVGGLSVAEEVIKQIAGADLIYFGDTAHVPYGSRSSSELIDFADRITDFLIQNGAGIIIDACNSTSSVALDYLRKKYANPIVGVIIPGVKAALKVTRNKKIGVIGTEATIKSGSHAKEAKKLDPEVRVIGVACPLFVPFVEKGEVESTRVLKVAEDYLRPLIKEGVDTLILGCTHYPYLRKTIARVVGPSVRIVDPAEETVLETKRIFYEKNKFCSKGEGRCEYYVSGDPNVFREVGSKLTGRRLPEVRRIVL